MDLDLFFNAIYKTLLHSLWQGVILTIIAGSIMLFGRNLKSSWRYMALSMSLLLFLGSAIYTFTLELAPSNALQAAGYNTSSTLILESENKNTGHLISTIVDEIHVFYDYYLAHFERALVFFWFVIICIKVVMMLFDLYWIHRLRSTTIDLLDVELKKTLKIICDSLKLNMNISVFESAIAKTPMVIGILKPIILIPIGLITAMTPQQIEVILAHEIAHIKRKDFLINLLQSIVEIIFFFNPFVLWISTLIRNERELCCDDIALKLTGSKIFYANTLVRFKEHEHKVSAYGMPFIGNRKSLLNRVKRILGISKSSLNSFDKFFLGLCLISAIFVTGIITMNSTSENKTNYYFSSFINPQGPEDPERIDSQEIVTQLIDSKLIVNHENFSIKITNFALYINGVRQSNMLHKQILRDYVKDNHKRLHYTYVMKNDEK